LYVSGGERTSKGVGGKRKKIPLFPTAEEGTREGGRKGRRKISILDSRKKEEGGEEPTFHFFHPRDKKNFSAESSGVSRHQEGGGKKCGILSPLLPLLSRKRNSGEKRDRGEEELAFLIWSILGGGLEGR